MGNSWNDDVDPDARIIQPTGLPLAIITTSSILLFFSLLLVAIRAHVRYRDGVLGWDDGLMVAGAVSHIASVAVAIAGQLTGIGTRDAYLNQWRFEEAMKIHTVWLLAYSLAMTLIKASICVTLRRITASKKSLRITVWVLLIITMISFVAAFIGTSVQCIPFEAHWKPYLVDQGLAWCAPTVVFVVMGYIATACTIVTDAALVAIPALLLWRTQMKMQAKLQVLGLMSFASIASLITVVRIPYLQKYGGPDNRHYWCAMIVFCSIIESSIGIMASSFPSLRRFIHRWNHNPEGGDSGATPNTDDIITFGARRSSRKNSSYQSGRNVFRNPTDGGISLATVHSDHWERLNDDESGKVNFSRKGIRTDYSYAVEGEDDTDESRHRRSKEVMR